MAEAQATERLFSYGTLQQENVQQATFGRTLKGCSDSLVGYRLDQVEIRDAAVVATSGLKHHPMLVSTGRPSDMVSGTVFLISPNELAQADAYEVSDYRRERAALASGNWAWVYVDARPPPE